MNINDVLVKECMNNYNYYRTKYNKRFGQMLNNSLVDKNNAIGSLIRYVGKENRKLFTDIFTDCKGDYSGIPEILILKHNEYFPREIIEIVEDRLSSWNIEYHQYL